MELITYLVYAVEIVLLNRWYYSTSKTLLNPFAFLSLPFTLILIICLSFNKVLDFIPFRYEGLWPWIFGLLFFWLPSLIVFKGRKIKATYSCIIPKVKNVNIITILILLCIAYMMLNLRELSSYDVGSKDLGQELAVGGLKGRVANMLLAVSPFIVCYPYKGWIKYVLISIAFYMFMAMGSKTWILYALLTSIICLYKERKIRFNIWWGIFVILLLFCAFALYYYLNTEIEDVEHFLTFVSRHFYFYLTSGILPLGEICKWGYQSNESFILPFINMFNIWSGYEGAPVHSSIWIISDPLYKTASNVFTFFGSLMIGESYVSFCVYSLFFGALSAIIFRSSQKCNNIFITILNGYNLCVLFFGWFNCAYALFRIWEIFLVSLLFYMISIKNLCMFRRYYS